MVAEEFDVIDSALKKAEEALVNALDIVLRLRRGLFLEQTSSGEKEKETPMQKVA